MTGRESRLELDCSFEVHLRGPEAGAREHEEEVLAAISGFRERLLALQRKRDDQEA